MRVLQWLLFAAVLCVVTPALAESPFELKEVGRGVYAAIDRDGKAGANAGVVIGEDGVLIVDSFYKPAAAAALLAEVRRITKLPVRYVVNTHHHIDHVAGNAIFAEAGASIVAHRNVRDWVRDENLRLMGGDKASAEARSAIAALKAPGLVYDGEIDIDLGKRRVRLRHLLGHTGGDTVVWVEDAKVLFGGDLLWRRTAPNLIDARVGEWLATLDRFLQAPAEAVFVPGHGDVASAADVAEFRGYLTDLRDFARDANGDETKVLERMSAKYGEWAYFKGLGPTGVKHMLAELAGTKRVPVPMRASEFLE